MRVFVYGTLKRGGYNHHYLSKAEFLGDYCTPPKYAFYDLGYYPAMTGEDKRIAVKGEVYQIDKKTIRELDILEGVPDLYDRITIRCGKYGQCYTYVMQRAPNNTPLILNGEWTK